MAMNRKIAAVVGADSAFVQELFANLVANWRSSGGRVVGLLGEVHEVPE